MPNIISTSIRVSNYDLKSKTGQQEANHAVRGAISEYVNNIYSTQLKPDEIGYYKPTNKVLPKGYWGMNNDGQLFLVKGLKNVTLNAISLSRAANYFKSIGFSLDETFASFRNVLQQVSKTNLQEALDNLDKKVIGNKDNSDIERARRAIIEQLAITTSPQLRAQLIQRLDGVQDLEYQRILSQ